MTDVLAEAKTFGQLDKLVAEFTHGAERQHELAGEIAAEIGTVQAALAAEGRSEADVFGIIADRYKDSLAKLSAIERKATMPALRAAGLSQNAVAQIHGVSVKTVKRSEKPTREVDHTGDTCPLVDHSEPAQPEPCTRCAELEAECVTLSANGAKLDNELERIHRSYREQQERQSAASVKLRRQLDYLKDEVVRLKSARITSSAFKQPGNSVFGEKVGKMLNLAIGSNSEDEAVLAFKKARAAHLTARINEGAKV